MAKALIVDDSKFMRRIIRSTLEEGGHQIIEEADNGADGIKCYKRLKPDFVTMDITMGGKDGIRAVMEITSLDPTAKIVVVSALNENTIRQNEPHIKASAFITKPFDKDSLLDAVNNALKAK
ncbi:MAG: two-component system response regulator [Spirochaetae bacterium HGW-Spirochaetae-1]|jgi:two-component system chemotaxis response regulator CheY|nr:MAG: two-component system response regulator [Spirochaetae bacterium HGW-Spirochaetae-1]